MRESNSNQLSIASDLSFEIMNFTMFASCHEFEILKSVIRPIVVFMMNILISLKFSTQMLLHKMSMLGNQFFIHSNLFIARFKQAPITWFCNFIRRINIPKRPQSHVVNIAKSFAGVFSFTTRYRTICSSVFRPVAFHGTWLRTKYLNLLSRIETLFAKRTSLCVFPIWHRNYYILSYK